MTTVHKITTQRLSIPEPSRNGISKGSWWKSNVLAVTIILLAAFIAYRPAWNGTPVWDDDGHITAPELRSLAGFGQIWTKLGATQQYYPLVHSVFWAEYRLWGDAPLGYHLLNILLHAISSLLLYKILRRLAIPGAWLAAAIFALHPIEVESVAWISELKNCLSGVFFFGAFLSYLQFDDRRTAKPYLASFGLFSLGLLAKTAIAPMPAAILVILWWKRAGTGRLGWKKDLLPLLPFFLAGVSFGLFTAWVEHKFIIAKEDIDFNYSLIERSLIAGRVFWFYLGKIFLPINLIFSYPRWEVSRAVWRHFLFPLAAVFLAAALWMLRRRSRAPFAALLYFVVMLFPALGFFAVFPFRYSFVADHFQYLAGIGPLVLAAACLSRGCSERRFAFAGRLLAGLMLFTLAASTWRQSGLYADAFTLYRATTQKNSASWMAWNGLGVEYMNAGQGEKAAECFGRSLEINPGNYSACNDLGILLTRAGRYGEAIGQFRRAITVKPDYYIAFCNLGDCLAGCGRTGEAIDCYRKSLEIQPAFFAALLNGGRALVADGRTDEGIGLFRRALELYPGSIPVLLNLGRACFKDGRIKDAAAWYRKVLDLNGADLKTLNDLCGVFMQLGQPDNAILAAKQALVLAKSTGQDALAREISGNIEEMNGREESQRYRATW
jgi:tetratricopeptide (TPR) repeat protein